MDKVEIKEITLEDIPDYVKVNIKAWQESYKGLIGDEILIDVENNVENSIKRKIDKFEEDKKNGVKKFILKVNNEPVGMMSVGKSRSKKFEGKGELEALYLLDKVKKKGYGKMLFDKAVEVLVNQGFKDMIIGCLVNNPSNNFYKHMGGKLIDTITSKVKEYDLQENIYYYEIK